MAISSACGEVGLDVAPARAAIAEIRRTRSTSRLVTAPAAWVLAPKTVYDVHVGVGSRASLTIGGSTVEECVMAAIAEREENAYTLGFRPGCGAIRSRIGSTPSRRCWR